MTFDDQLKHAFDTLTERLREELDRQVRTVAEELTTAAHAERDNAATEARLAAEQAASIELERVVARTRQDAREEGLAVGHHEGHQQGLAAGRDAGHEEGHEKGIAVGRQAGHDEGYEKGLASGRDAGRDEGYEKGLASGRDAGRDEGLEEGRRLGVLEGREQAEEEKRIAIEAALASAAASAPPRTGAEELADSIRAIERASSLTEILDTLVTCAAREAARAGVWLVRGSSLHHWRSTGFDAPDADVPLDGPTTLARAVRSDVAASDADGLAVPMALNGEVVAVLYVANPDSQVSNPAAIEVLTRYAARCLEALTAFKAARALTAPGRASAGAVDAATAAEMAERDVSARRYARLLVSEIKLYHEAAVVEGRRDRDLASRLGGEIARARSLYDERVPADVRLRVDYFHDELVRTLADGDATLLQLT